MLNKELHVVHCPICSDYSITEHITKDLHCLPQLALTVSLTQPRTPCDEVLIEESPLSDWPVGTSVRNLDC